MVIKNLIRNACDCSLDGKSSGVPIPKGFWDGQVLSERALA